MRLPLAYVKEPRDFNKHKTTVKERITDLPDYAVQAIIQDLNGRLEQCRVNGTSGGHLKKWWLTFGVMPNGIVFVGKK